MALLSVRELVTRFEFGPHSFNVVDGVSLDVEPGETVGIVGESGSGKSSHAPLDRACATTEGSDHQRLCRVQRAGLHPAGATGVAALTRA